MKIVISSGHGLHVRGASSQWLDEVDEARLVVEQVATMLRSAGVGTTTYHDDWSTTQSENLNRIVNFHNSKTRDLDVSVHFNAYQTTQSPMGCEVLYVSNNGLSVADIVVDDICTVSGLKNRGPKKRTDLAFLNGTEETAILIETCFCDSKADVDIYRARFGDICGAIAGAISGEDIDAEPGPEPPEPEPEPPSGALLHVTGRCSHFGGPQDTGVAPDEGLAFIYDIDDAPHLFLPYQPTGTSGLARRLNPYIHYIACRWNYDVTSREMLKEELALVRAGGMELTAFPADWGPNENTGRVADLSPQLMTDLRLTTDDEVEVIFPAPE